MTRNDWVAPCLGIVWLALTINFAACAGVDASADFRAAAATARERTGSEVVWEPEAGELAIAEAVDAMTVDGRLTVGEAIRIGLLCNPSLQASFMDVGIASADLVAAGRLRNPVMGASARFPEGGGLADVQFSISQSLTGLLLLESRRHAGEARLAMARASAVRQAVILAGRIEQRALDLVALAMAIEVSRESLTLAETSRELVSHRFDAGLSDAIDLHMAELAVLDARRALLVIQRERDLAHATLAEDLSLTEDTPAWRIVGDLVSANVPDDPEALVQIALEHRLDVEVANWLVKASRADTDLEEHRIFQALSVGFQRERGNNPPSLNGPSAQFSLPVFGLNGPAVARQQFREMQAARNLETIRLAVTREVRQASFRVSSSRELLTLFDQEILPAALASVEASRRAWSAGQRDLLAVVAAQGSLLQQRGQYVAALREAASAKAALDAALGGPFVDGDGELHER